MEVSDGQRKSANWRLPPSRHVRPKCGLCSVEDDGATSVHEHAMAHMGAHRSRQNGDLEVATFTPEIFDVVTVAHADDVLFDDRAVVELCGRVVSRDADELDAALVCLVIGPRSLEGGQERVVDVDDAARPRLAER